MSSYPRPHLSLAPDGYAAALYSADVYAADPYATDVYTTDPFATDPFATDPYAPDSYSPDSYAPVASLPPVPSHAADIDADDDSWRQNALCAETDPEAFFPEKGGSTREAKRVCVGCPVRLQCLEFALDKDERFGIWGGLSERERRRVRLARREPLSA